MEAPAPQLPSTMHEGAKREEQQGFLASCKRPASILWSNQLVHFRKTWLALTHLADVQNNPGPENSPQSISSCAHDLRCISASVVLPGDQNPLSSMAHPRQSHSFASNLTSGYMVRLILKYKSLFHFLLASWAASANAASSVAPAVG